MIILTPHWDNLWKAHNYGDPDNWEVGITAEDAKNNLITRLFDELTMEQQDEYCDCAAELLRGLLVCIGDWSTCMSQRDFCDATDDDDKMYEIAKVLYKISIAGV